ncbi:valine--tRNA ligase [bacterium (Candidatus Gribaldobacteria) CG08_land_8_20_14_0_20_39_15]|uniref:valine--tRNA ligase n=1 Tax=bacterium (Candidatus Gribaldobacteria) CG08_land_8_20_14_0_20_39_15 TaxID=2014273 RepID=A0A2M6XVC4_9BACT|nr:MAG: valine--tRNA ligase [bacterium (Candidatus Gribaldobacteria) CG08_land_8_20_14_0_20_39_15]
MKELSKVYNPKEVEDKIYNLWLRSGFFNPDKLPKTYNLKPKTYCIVIPPPNVTGELHMGHALNATIQDILIRWKRMAGFKTLWLPGTDHAGIATQNVVEKELKKEGLTRFELGREKFLERVWQWKEKYGNIILEQLKKMGSSCDWSRTRFTMDQDYVKAVETAFLHYYKKGWIYRGKKVINWCPRCQTSLSDLEIEYKEERGNLWYIKYLLKGGTGEGQGRDSPSITVATTRPETMLGDMAVAVNPKDKRYKNLVGKKVILPLVNREIPIIADRLVDPKFGTGVVKITPAHDLTDYEISLKHNLPMIQVISEQAKIVEKKVHVPISYRGLSILEAREKMVKDLEKLGFLEKVEDYSLSLSKCYRCDTTLEILPSEQWFLRMKELAKKAKKGRVLFIPRRWEKIYFDWLKNIKDWCISRQIWWGHKIPIEGSEDVLDTWFSSALWPFATLGWPKKTKDLKRFYPTDVLSTDRGIINLWVARMIFSGMEFMKKIPFKDVYIHATVLTREGKRMSKSLGTGVDPINLIEKYGADATRFGITWQIMGGQDIRFVEDNIVMGRKFCNKIWNASRFVLLQIKNTKSAKIPSLHSSGIFAKKKNLTPADKRILSTLDKTIKSVNKGLENFRFGKAAQTLYNFFWHDFCDRYIEATKKRKNEKTKKILLYTLLTSLKLLHPFIPFITEEIYQKLPIKSKKRCLMVEKWPK